jgi:hypothetical protein
VQEVVMDIAQVVVVVLEALVIPLAPQMVEMD